MTRLLPRAVFAAALSVSLALVSLTQVAPSPASAGDGVPVFHDRVSKRDPAGDVKGDSTRPVDVRKVVYDHYRTGPGPNNRLVMTVRFAESVSSDITLQWELATTGEHVTVKWDIGGRVTVIRDGEKSSSRGAERSVDGNVAKLTLPWGRLGSPRRINTLLLLATYDIDGLDIVRIKRDLR
ncbi:hypothetical protein [Nocardioides dilutus]